MFGLGFTEIIFILFVGILVLGPEHMPRAARLIGKWSAKMRSAASSLSAAVAQDEDLRGIQNDLKAAKSDIDAARAAIMHPISEIQTSVLNAKEEIAVAGRACRDIGISSTQAISEDKAPSSTEQAPTADDSNTPSHAVTEDSHPNTEEGRPSDFLSRPMRWFNDEDENSSNSSAITAASEASAPSAQAIQEAQDKSPSLKNVSLEASDDILQHSIVLSSHFLLPSATARLVSRFRHRLNRPQLSAASNAQHTHRLCAPYHHALCCANPLSRKPSASPMVHPIEVKEVKRAHPIAGCTRSIALPRVKYAQINKNK